MKKRVLFLLLSVSFISLQLLSQITETKFYKAGLDNGIYKLAYNYGEIQSSIPTRTYVVDIIRPDNYYIATLSNLQSSQTLYVYVDDVFFGKMTPTKSGWQYVGVDNSTIYLTPGKHTIRFTMSDKGITIPMIEEVLLTRSNPNYKNAIPENINRFVEYAESLQQQSISTPMQFTDENGLSNKVLPNPLGTYSHAIDTSFNYSHFSTIYLSVGNHTFTTINSTINKALTIFNPANYTYSWSNVNGGPGGESALNLYVGLAGYYNIMLRPVTNGTTGTTTILYNGNVLVTNAIINGKTYAMPATKGGELNFFTAKLTSGDTRILASKHFSSSARGYNDDYNGTGNYSWGLASRIKKNFGTDSVQYAFVCAYSPTSSGNCDIYLGNENSNVYAANYPEFPSLNPDDAIKAAPSSGTYNCISWTGGITSFWAWPPSQYSTYSCTSSYGDITCFDNFYANNPVRYPGAWTYTRTGATVSNAIVDLWKLGTNFTHASVQKPGNNNPHGYDWESKPGGLTRTFHPRNALANNSFGYGVVTNYYKHSGAYARNSGATQAIDTDADAVKAGLAIFDIAKLTDKAVQKLNTLLAKVDKSIESEFENLYENWKKTWATNAVYSDPSMYCKNNEHEAMLRFSIKHNRQTMLICFNKFSNGDHLIGELMWTLTKDKYAHLLTEVKDERSKQPNDEAGRYKIHSDHDNGVLYIEKILKVLEAEIADITTTQGIDVLVSPNPVKDILKISLKLTEASKVTIRIISAQSGVSKVLLPETNLQFGSHRLSYNIAGATRQNGDVLAVQVTVNDLTKTIKVLVAN